MATAAQITTSIASMAMVEAHKSKNRFQNRFSIAISLYCVSGIDLAMGTPRSSQIISDPIFLMLPVGTLQAATEMVTVAMETAATMEMAATGMAATMETRTANLTASF